jgi:FkbM family methyltransferase
MSVEKEDAAEPAALEGAATQGEDKGPENDAPPAEQSAGEQLLAPPAEFGAPPARMSIEALYQHVSRLGLVPGCVIDIGAAYGDFTRMAARIAPDAEFLMFEPLAEYQASLNRVVEEVPRTYLVMAAAAEARGSMTINVHGDLMGSSLMYEWEEASDVNGVPRDVAVTTVDAEIANLGWPEDIWLKIDVQGAELKVLAGAEETLRRTQLLVVETTLFNTFGGGPLAGDIVTYMAERGFVLYDIAGFLYRPLDGALMQLDLAFVPKDSPLRRHHAFATPEQRREITAYLAARRDS